MRRHFAVFLLLLLTTSVRGVAANDRWVEVRSEHFTVLTDSGEKEGRRIASQFERMRAVFHQLLPNANYDNGARPIVVLAFKDKKGFQTVEPVEYLAKGQLNLAGYFQRSPDENFVVLRLDTEGEHPFATVYHEYTHYMLARAQDWMPLWMNEGMAEFYQNTDIAEKEVLLGQPSSNDILYLREQKLLPLATLLQVDHASPYYHDEQKGSVFYAESWALMHYIEMSDNEKGTHHLQEYAQRLIAHEDPVTAAQHVFGDLGALQKVLDNYVFQQSFRAFRMKSGVTVDESKFQVREVLGPEVNARRAYVLISDKRIQDAQALLETALRDDPKNALAHETMGYLKFRENDLPGAKKWYGEAVQLDPDNYLTHFHFGEMALRSGDTGKDDAVESSLRTSIKLNPSFAPAYDALAMFYASRQEKLDEAHMLNLQAVQLAPDNLYYRLNAASVLGQNQQFTGAIGVLKAAQRWAKTPAEIAMVQSRLDQFQSYQSAVEARKTGGTAAGGNSEQMVTVRRANGETVQVKTIQVQKEEVHYPADATGPQRTVSGVLSDVRCSYPSVLTLTVGQTDKPVTLYSNDFYKIVFTLGNYESDAEIQPCKGIAGMKAKVVYAEVTDARVAGQIVSIELNK